MFFDESELDLFLSSLSEGVAQTNKIKLTRSVPDNGSYSKMEYHRSVSQDSPDEGNAHTNLSHSVRNSYSRTEMEEARCKLERHGSQNKVDEEKKDRKPFPGASTDTISEFKELSLDDKLVEMFKQMCLQSERMQRVENEVKRLSVEVEVLNKSRQMQSTRNSNEPLPGPSRQKREDQREQIKLPFEHAPSETDTLTIGALNVGSLKARTKPGEAYNNFCSLVNKYDIFCCSETKLVTEGITDIITIKGYQLINQARKELMVRASGGIGCFVKRSLLKFVSVVSTESEYVMWLKISKSWCHTKEDVMIGNIYIVPETSDYFFSEEELDILQEEISSTCKAYNYVILTGDMNARTADCNYLERSTIDKCKRAAHPDVFDISESRTSQDLERNTIGEWLIETCTANKFYILNGRFGKDKDVGKFTFKETSVIDYTACTAAVLKLLKDFEIINDVACGGHSLVKTVLKYTKT